MSLHPHVVAPVPEDTARVAHAAFPKGHPYKPRHNYRYTSAEIN